MWEGQHQQEFVATIVQKSTTIYHIHWYKTKIEFLIAPSCQKLIHKIKLDTQVSVPLITLLLQYGPPGTSENARFCILMAVSSLVK